MADLVYERRKAVYCKIESTRGVDANPSAATDGVLLREDELQLNPTDIEFVPRSIVRAFYGSFKQVVAAKWVTAQVSLEMAGVGGPGPASPTPGYDALLRAGGLQRVVTPGTQVAWSPVSTGFETLSFAWNQDGRLHKMLGTVCESVVWTANVNEIPRITFNLLGAYVPVVDQALPNPDLSAYLEPLTVGSANTGTFALHGYAACMNQLSITKTNTTARRNLVNCNQQARVSNHEITGQAQIEGTRVADFDPWSRVASGQLGALAFEHGTVAGNIVGLSAGNVQLTNISRAPEDDIEHLNVDLSIQPGAAGNDDLTYLAK